MSVNTPDLVIGMAKLLADVLVNPRDVVQLGKDLVDLVTQSGVSAALLSDYLTDTAQRQVDEMADIKEDAKLKLEEIKP